MRRSLLLPVLLLASCGQGSDQGSAPSGGTATYDAAEAPAAPSEAARTASGPDIGPTAAPGVAFTYRYSFRLAAPRIAEVQEEHARMCEQLSVARCRITGMRYRVVNERDIEAMLAFNLDPALARRFGRAGVEAVVRSEGMLTESEISGTDVGTGIARAGRSLAEMQADLARVEARLAARGLRAEERVRLDEEAKQLREAIRAVRDERETQQDALATTPMTFNYGSGELVPGFDDGPSFRRAWERAASNLLEGGLALFIILATLLPWALLALAGWVAFRFVRRRWPGKRSEVPAVSSQPAP